MKKFTLVLLAVIGFTAANAQTSTANQTVTLTLQNKIEISVDGTPGGTSFTFATAADYSDGITNLNASSFRVKSNQNFAVTVAAAAATFTTSAATPMNASVLGVRLNGSSSAFTSLSTTAASLHTGTRGNSTFAVDYKADPGFTHDAGSYTLSLVYTATQQ